MGINNSQYGSPCCCLKLINKNILIKPCQKVASSCSCCTSRNLYVVNIPCLTNPIRQLFLICWKYRSWRPYLVHYVNWLWIWISQYLVLLMWDFSIFPRPYELWVYQSRISINWTKSILMYNKTQVESVQLEKTLDSNL